MPRSGTIVATATKIAATGGREAAKRQGFNWFQRNRHLCELNRGLQNLGTPCKGVKHAKRAAPTGANFLLVRKFPKRDVFTFFSLLRKEPKVAEGPRPSRLPENGSKLYRIVFSCCFRLSSLNQHVVRPAFSDVLNRCERVIVVQTQDRYFPKLGCRTASSQGHVTFKKGSCSLSLLR